MLHLLGEQSQSHNVNTQHPTSFTVQPLLLDPFAAQVECFDILPIQL